MVFGCDDTAKNEFLNKRAAKGKLAGPGQSQSNLWFVEPKRLDALGTPLGRGTLWLNDQVAANAPSDPFLLDGYTRRGLHLVHSERASVTVALEIDERGDGRWRVSRTVVVPPGKATWIELRERGAWIRLRTDRACGKITAAFQYRNVPRPLATEPNSPATEKALLYARGGGFKTLRAVTNDGRVYDLDEELNLKRAIDPVGARWMRENVAIPIGVWREDAASAIFADDAGARWRLPKFRADEGRVCREVCTERDLFHCHGTLYELPAENAGGFAKIRPIATHDRAIYDYASWRGLLVTSGIVSERFGRVVRSDDGKLSLWVGVVDDLWALGKPRGEGGPWANTRVRAGEPSDPFLLTGYDWKALTLSHAERSGRIFRVEVDLTGTGLWAEYERFSVAPGQRLVHRFPDAFGAYWLRVTSDQDAVATAQLRYA